MPRPGSATHRLLAAAWQGPARGNLIVTVLAGLVLTGMILAQAGLLARILAGADQPARRSALVWLLAGLLAVVLVRAAAAQTGEITALRTAACLKQRLRDQLLAHVMDLGPSWLRAPDRPPADHHGDGIRIGRTGEISALATGGLDTLDPYFARLLPQAMLAMAVPVAVLVAVTWADWLSGVIIAVTLPVIPLLAALVGWHVKAQTSRNWRLLARLSGHFLDVVQGLPTLKVFGRAKTQEQVIARVTGEYRTSVMATLRVAFLSALVLELSAALATALVAVETGLRLLYGHIGYPTALFVLLLTPEAYLPLRNASAAFHASADGTAVAARVFAILDTPAPEGTAAAAAGRQHGPERTAAATTHSPRPDLRSQVLSLNGVTVGYPGREQPVITGADLTIRPGELLLLTGPNGAGKSSLLALLLKFLEPVAGRVDVSGTDLAAVPADPWRRQIGWLPQRPWLFPWSVADNIALGRPKAPMAAIERAAVLAGADGFVTRLPDGYRTVLDERGLALSAGQRQQIALARLFLRDAPLLLLDEPAAHLDPVCAAEVAASIAALAAERTVLLVTHRAEPVAALHRRARTLLVSGGRLTEAAPVSRLLAEVAPMVGP